jgi:hypothetical protein
MAKRQNCGMKTHPLLDYKNLNSQPLLHNSKEDMHKRRIVVENICNNRETTETVFSVQSVVRPYTRN